MAGGRVTRGDRWFQNGDHPRDEYKRGTGNEGKVVRRYRNPDVDGQTVCETCGYIMHDHGWLDDGITVCPGAWIITREDPSWPDPRYAVCTHDAFYTAYPELTAGRVE